MKAPYCKVCNTDHWSTQPHGGALTSASKPVVAKAALAKAAKPVGRKRKS